MKTVFVLCGAILSNALANILMKVGMSNAQNKANLLEVAKSAVKSVPIVVGVICFVTALFLYLYVLSRLPLSVAYPIMTGAGFAIVALASHFFLNESITLWRVCGFVAIVCGICLVAR